MSKSNQTVKKISIKELGILFQETKSEKVFNQIFNLLKPTVVNYYRKIYKNEELVFESYVETMTWIWNNVDKIDVYKYSISTMIFLRVKHRIIDNYRKKQFLDIDEPSVINHIEKDTNLTNAISYNIEQDFIYTETNNTLWNCVYLILNNELNFNIFYDKYYNEMKVKDIADKYKTKQQIVLNRIFNAKEKLIENKYYLQQYEQYV